MKKFIIYTSYFLLINNSLASNWVNASSNKTTSLLVDLDSISPIKLQDYSGFKDDNIFISAFVKEKYKKGHEFRDEKGVYTLTQQWYVSCQNKRYIMNDFISYDKNDSVIQRWHNPISMYRESDWTVAYPDTIADYTIQVICYNANTPKPTHTPSKFEQAFDKAFESITSK